METERVLILFLTRYYQVRLQDFEQLALEHCTTNELFKMATEVSSLHKFILDSYEEGYTQSTDQIVSQSNALDRLQRLLTNLLQKLGLSCEPEQFYLCPEPVYLDTIDTKQFEDGQTFELLAYLDHLDHQSDHAIEIGHCFASTNQQQRWQNKTQIVMTEMVDFLIWVWQQLKRQPQAVPVPLLRDTLVVQLGLKLLQHHGIPVREPKPLFIGRKFLATFPGGEKVYYTLNSDIFYGILCDLETCDLTTLRHQFIARARVNSEIPTSFIQASKDYLATLALDGPPLIIESGMHGTFPLWLLTLTDNIGDMLLYCTVPWLYSTYQDIVFRKNYNYLRDVETIVAHDYLFQFETMSNDKMFVKETSNAITKNLALYELYLFKNILRQKIPELT